jgi:hypothetical protein
MSVRDAAARERLERGSKHGQRAAKIEPGSKETEEVGHRESEARHNHVI